MSRSVRARPGRDASSPRVTARRRAARGAARLLAGALLGAALLPLAPLGAQAAPRVPEDGWRATRVAKWALLAVSAGFGYYAYRESALGDDRYDELRRRCEATNDFCRLENGRYADPAAERLFRGANDHDRAARLGILAGQATLLGSAAFFIIDLRHGGSPEDIPYDPSRPGRARAALRVGLRWTP